MISTKLYEKAFPPARVSGEGPYFTAWFLIIAFIPVATLLTLVGALPTDVVESGPPGWAWLAFGLIYLAVWDVIRWFEGSAGVAFGLICLNASVVTLGAPGTVTVVLGILAVLGFFATLIADSGVGECRIE
jgi:hypothetical protein